MPINEAYFAQARQVFDRDVMTAVAVGAGLDAGAVGEVLDGDGYAEAVRQDELTARELGISGVPVLRLRHGARGVRGAADADVRQRAEASLD